MALLVGSCLAAWVYTESWTEIVEFEITDLNADEGLIQFSGVFHQPAESEQTKRQIYRTYMEFTDIELTQFIGKTLRYRRRIPSPIWEGDDLNATAIQQVREATGLKLELEYGGLIDEVIFVPE